MINIYNELSHKDNVDDHVVRAYIEDYFDNHQYLDFTNVLVWIKEANPEESRGPVLFECSVEVRVRGKAAVYASKKNNQLLIGVREALDTVKNEILKQRQKINDKNSAIGQVPF
ncbi:MAG: hypothetical protein KC478_09300 [Bacteriovoracaceae bacterium]|nr:hypothetical protein [Bacteriovoracaceae bacterium]